MSDKDMALPASQDRAASLRPQPPTASSQSGIPSAEAAVRLAYGLLWHMAIDRSDPNLRLASDARRALLTVLSKDEQADGIARAKGTDARFTGAT